MGTQIHSPEVAIFTVKGMTVSKTTPSNKRNEVLEHLG
jgi:hypothetical protein